MSALDDLTHLVREPLGEPEGAVILLHGRGSDQHDLYHLLDDFDPQRRLLGVTLRGPLSLPPGGAHWYVLGPVGYPEAASFAATWRLVDGWLDEFAAATGIPPSATILGGFSQGTVMSYAMGLGAGRPRPAGIVAMSGFIPTVEGFSLDLSAPLPPVAIGHGAYDGVIPVDFGRKARDLLVGAGAAVTYRESRFRHGIDPAFLSELGPWVDAALAATGARTP